MGNLLNHSLSYDAFIKDTLGEEGDEEYVRLVSLSYEVGVRPFIETFFSIMHSSKILLEKKKMKNM